MGLAFHLKGGFTLSTPPVISYFLRFTYFSIPYIGATSSPWRKGHLLGASNGSTYRVLDFLQREDLITKNGDRYLVTRT